MRLLPGYWGNALFFAGFPKLQGGLQADPAFINFHSPL